MSERLPTIYFVVGLIAADATVGTTSAAILSTAFRWATNVAVSAKTSPPVAWSGWLCE